MTPVKPTPHKNQHLIIIGIVAALLLAGVIFLGFKYTSLHQENVQLKNQINQNQTNNQIVGFLNLFIEKVLKSDSEVSFDDRLRLDAAVKNLRDPELLAQWKAFTQGKTIQEIQANAKILLESLVKKLSY